MEMVTKPTEERETMSTTDAPRSPTAMSRPTAPPARPS